MSRYSSLKEKLANREEVFSTTIANIEWSGLVQKIATYPFDFVIFDCEHGTLSLEGIEDSLRVCRLMGFPSIVRIADTVPNIISKTLDMGADGLIIPRVERIEQIELVIRSARYYPRGRKGCGGFSNLRPDDEGSTAKFNDNRLLFIQIESNEGLSVLEEIITKYRTELAGIIVGPYDASIMLEQPLNIFHKDILEFDKKVFDTCNRLGIASGIFVDSSNLIEKYRELGANIFWVGTELSLLSESYEILSKTLRSKI